MPITPAELARRQALIERSQRGESAEPSRVVERAALLAKLQSSYKQHTGEDLDAQAHGFRPEEIAHAALLAGAPIAATIEHVDAGEASTYEASARARPRKGETRVQAQMRAAKQAREAELEAQRRADVAERRAVEAEQRRANKAARRELKRAAIAAPETAVAVHIDALRLDELDAELAQQDAAAGAPAADHEQDQAGGSQAPAAAVANRRKYRSGAERALAVATRQRGGARPVREKNKKYRNVVERLKAKDDRRQAAWAKECAEKHDGKRAPYIPVDQWRMGRELVLDRAGRSCEWWIAHFARIHGPAAVALVVRAALAISDDGEAGYDWEQDRARKVLAAGLFMLAMSRRDRRHRAPRRAAMRDSKIVRGISRQTLAALLQDPYTDKRPSNTALTGYWRTGNVFKGEVGYVRALVETGAIYRHQLPPDSPKLETWEIGNVSGYAMNRYHVSTQFTLEVSEALALGQWLQQLLDGQHVYELRRRARATQPDAPN